MPSLVSTAPSAYPSPKAETAPGPIPRTAGARKLFQEEKENPKNTERARTDLSPGRLARRDSENGCGERPWGAHGPGNRARMPAMAAQLQSIPTALTVPPD